MAKSNPKEAVGVMLLPDHSTYVDRWQARSANDNQGNEERWQADHKEWIGLSQKMEAGSQQLWVRLKDTDSTCPDGSIANMCRQVMLGLVARPELLCFYCKRASPTSRFATYCAECNATFML